MITPRYCAGAIYLDGKIYIFCGSSNGDYNATSMSEVYNIETDTWKALPNCPITSYSVTATVLRGMIYITG
jgi:hypothetical protein